MSKQIQRESLLPPLWILFIFILYGLWWLIAELREVVMFLLIGYIAAYILDPVLDWLQRRKIGRSIGILLILVLFTLFMTFVFLTAIPPFLEDVNHVADNFPTYSQTVRIKILELMQWVSAHLPPGVSLDELKSRLTAMPDVSGDTVRKIFGGFFSFLLEGYSITLTLVNLALLPFIIYYLSLDIDSFHGWVLKAIPKKSRRYWQDLFLEINSFVRAFIVGQTTVCTILFVLYCIGFKIVGLKQWFFLGVIAGFGNMIPYFGTISGIILSTTLALVTYGTFSSVVCTWIVFGVVQFLEGMLITPKIVGDKVGLSPLIVILAIVIGGKLFGLLGIFLAIPGAASMRVLVRHGYQMLLKRIETA